MRPTPRAILLFFAALPLAILPAFVGANLWVVWMAFVGGFMLALGLDVVLGVPKRRLQVDVEAPRQLIIGKPGHVDIHLARGGAGTGSAPVRLMASLSERFEVVKQLKLEVPRGGAVAKVPLLAGRRGVGRIERLWLRWTGPFGLMSRTRVDRLEIDIPVVTDLSPVRAFALAHFTPRESASGLKVERYIGDGTEFEALREYVRGLDPRGINWRQTARHRKLICQEFRAERNHAVVVAVDAGRLMSDPVERIPKVDHAVTAGLVLTYAALHTGDRVGLYSFDAQPRQWIAPLSGAGAFPRLVHHAAQIDYTQSETNFTLGLAELGARLSRRTLVVLLTDFTDTITAELMLDHVHHLARKHKVVFVAISDPTWKALSSNAPRSPSQLYQAVVAQEFGDERAAVLHRLQRMGVICIDAPPSAISTQLVNQYLQVKRREVLG